MIYESARRAPIICLEGASAVGKSTLAAALAEQVGAVVVGELHAGNAPPIPESSAWFVEQHVKQWQRGVDAAASAPLVVLDGDPFKGLWYNWIYADAGWPGVDFVAPLYQARIAQETLAFPDLYVVMQASDAQLRARRAADATRRRRNFETHLRLVAPQRRYFAALENAAPGRVLWLDATERELLPKTVLAATTRLPRTTAKPDQLLNAMVVWVRTHDPDSSG